ncbi:MULTISPECIES: DUF4406 domain-containing protein [unclassified Breznakia]|uniref:DUF4406 domain-containing protein n=1 Tax=unclassified Breznakia TaxID=2623764 RepID=UPI002474FEA0|nr:MULTISPECIES: DUF4406 domain-containing protein [unclassified Breznakia]MDH6367537.1 nucleoside 2-deoxyribosyltransferase [Breznakia sp. PH1-1]MDH6404669.1 nucleoside 2-deoxyribosyltransferase [Breznakia sp. PF1-11]MDH6412367.1 nucleoside 2-deoxyribosyltransferase [Breznakia sp. PFB1-11]MDH6414705.1 nucleoside 2-deoxyribosyltransferase [Breznakia sp. PFB1-14]MDH6417050.1 nucleoside 2-deoxyribosyltransferase [Breznakia sp. PFB1-4]
MKIYLAGPITGTDDYVERFKEVEESLTNPGVEVVNPVTDEHLDYEEYIIRGLKMLAECDWIFMLDDWENSKGAKLEYQYAKTVGKRIVFQGDDDMNFFIEKSLAEITGFFQNLANAVGSVFPIEREELGDE